MLKMITLTPIAAALALTACQNVQRNPYPIVKETYIHKYGVPVPQRDWDERGRDGQVVQTMKDGVTISKSYQEGIQHGPTTHSYPHSSATQKTESYDKGVLVKEVEHYRSGPPQKELQHGQNNELTITTWYENGTPKNIEKFDSNGSLVKGEYYNTSHQVEAQVENRNGIRIIRNQYGQVSSKDTIQDGVMTVRTTFHYNGSTKDVTPFKNGTIHGLKKTYLPDGEPSTQETWENGRQNGVTTLFQNGDKFAEIPYVDGQKHGIEKHYRDGQQLVEEVSWYNGLQEGPHTVYADDAASTDWYFEGEPVTKANYDLRIHASKRPYIQTNLNK